MIAQAIHGKVPRRGPEPGPSPDLIGIDSPISHSDLIDTDRALGLEGVSFRGASRDA